MSDVHPLLLLHYYGPSYVIWVYITALVWTVHERQFLLQSKEVGSTNSGKPHSRSWDKAFKTSTVYDWYNWLNVVENHSKTRRAATGCSQPLSQWLRVALLIRSNWIGLIILAWRQGLILSLIHSVLFTLCFLLRVLIWKRHTMDRVHEADILKLKYLCLQESENRTEWWNMNACT